MRSDSSKLGKSLRDERGAVVVVATLFIAFFVIAVVGLFGFEITRATMAREQLKSACQSAAMAGAATMAGSDDKDTANMQRTAMANAMATFQKNYCLGLSLKNAQQSANQTPDTNECCVTMRLLDPDKNNQSVAIGDPAGKVLQIAAVYGLEPAFHRFLGLKTLPLESTASAGVPMMDIVMCFDVSGSIDDQTPVTFVKRYWDPKGKNAYQVTQAKSGSKAGALAQGPIYDVIGPKPTGTGTNAVYPQDLQDAGMSDNRWPIYFSEHSGFGSSSSPGLRGSSNSGSKPGNAPTNPKPSSMGTSYTFTDLAVNIDGKNQFGGFSSGGYDFPDVGTLVEAARGNLESAKIMADSGADTSLTVKPRPGYQTKYLELARKQIHPLGDAQDAAQLFFTILNNDTSAHFGFVSFSTNAGTTGPGPNRTNIDVDYPAGGNSNFPIPLLKIDPSVSKTNFDEIMQAIPTTTAYGSTNIGDSLRVAVDMLKSSARPGSRKAIVLFTDGQPTAGGPLSNDEWANARLAAQQAKAAGIPIYTIGLAQNTEIIPGEKAILNDWDKNPASGGVAGIAGNDGQFFLVTDQKYLRTTFQNLARQFVQIIRG